MIVIYREILLLNIVILFTVFFIKGHNSVREHWDTVIKLISPKVTFLKGVILFYQMNPPLIDLNQSVNQLIQPLNQLDQLLNQL